jgi:glycosyltransferase involved in cell wall biosynthesis
MKKKVILSVINDLSTDQRVHKVCLFLQKIGYEVLLVGRRQRTSLPLAERTYRTKRMFLFFENGPLFYLEYNLRLFLFLLFNKADVLVANDLDTLLPNFLISKIKGGKLVFDSHEYFTEVPELQGRKFKQWLWKRLELWILPQLKNAYTVNQSIADLYKKNYGIKMKVVRNFPSPHIRRGGDWALPYIQRWNSIILYQGALNIDRGLEEAIEGMQYVNNATLVIIGGGDIEDKLKGLTNDLGLSDRVIFYGRIPLEQLPKYTAMADIGISLEKDTNLNYRYSLPNKIFDYIHSSVPVLASPLHEIKKIFSLYDIGELIENHDPKHIAEKITSMLNNKTNIQRWKENEKKAAVELCWENEEKVLLKIYGN